MISVPANSGWPKFLFGKMQEVDAVKAIHMLSFIYYTRQIVSKNMGNDFPNFTIVNFSLKN